MTHEALPTVAALSYRTFLAAEYSDERLEVFKAHSGDFRF